MISRRAYIAGSVYAARTWGALETWRATHELGLAIQMHFIPHYAAQIGELAARFREMPIILDHMSGFSAA